MPLLNPVNATLIREWHQVKKNYVFRFIYRNPMPQPQIMKKWDKNELDFNLKTTTKVNAYEFVWDSAGT